MTRQEPSRVHSTTVFALNTNTSLLYSALSAIILFLIESGCSYRSYYSLRRKSSSLGQVVLFGSQHSTIVVSDHRTGLRGNQAMARAAIAQLCSTPDKIENLVSIARCAGLAKKSGACMVSRNIIDKHRWYLILFESITNSFPFFRNIQPSASVSSFYQKTVAS